MSEQPFVVVTGANGFIGRYLCARWREAGRPIRALMRALPATEVTGPVHAMLPDQIACGDLAQIAPERLLELLRGAEAVVHLAGRAHVMRETVADPASAYALANVETTRRVAEAAVAAGVPRLVYASTVKVNGDVSVPGRPFVESDPPNPHDDYARSKWNAERVLADVTRETTLRVTVLRLPLVYGPGVGGNFARLIGAVRRGVPLPLGALANRRSLLFVGNLADALDAVLAQPAAAAGSARTWFVADAQPVATPALVRELARAMGVAPRLFSVPQLLLRSVAQVTGATVAVERLAGSLEVETMAIRDALRWAPPFTLAEGIAQTVR